MASTPRLTPAQRRALVLLATPGAEAYVPRSIRWTVVSHLDGRILGSIHSESLAALRDAGLVDWRNGGAHPTDFRQRINAAGRAYLAGKEQQQP